MTTAATMFVGTGAYASKTLVSVALLRLLTRRGVKAAPFKAMVVLRSRDEERAALHGSGLPHHLAAAGLAAADDHCPTTVRQTAPCEGLLSRRGAEPVPVSLPCRDTVDLASVLAPVRAEVVAAAHDALRRLAATCDHLVIEGAGSPVVLEPEQDLPNIATARWARPAIVLTGQFSHGNAAAALIGTYTCLPADVRSLVRGFVVANTPESSAVPRALTQVEDACGIPGLGVLPSDYSLGYDELYTESAIERWADSMARHVDVDALLAAGGRT
ncbi:hypothetical protein [Streptomyces sp. CA-111067]|uniref:hypothetical protein n=1 Tax=Streptomyces sp. CA-111067 TaxID=3240046 RepID=UPI003D9551A9